jgi:hypothetical protein
MVVPLHKKWEATGARIQVVQQNKTIQLLAFFGSDFSHGRCMNFVLKGTDIYENFNRSGKSGIRIVDAKFALPKTDDDESARFVCLDMPEYPIEHDDINIVFESETGASAAIDYMTCITLLILSQIGLISWLSYRDHSRSRLGCPRSADK